MQNRKTVWPWALAGVVVVGAAGWWLFRDNLQTLSASSPFARQAPATAVPAPATPAAPAAPAAVAAEPEPAAAEHPLPRDASADATLPALADSDAAARQALDGLFGSDVLALLHPEHLIQRAVVHIDNLTQTRVPGTALALKPVPGQLQVEGDAASGITIAAANAKRYAPWVDAFTHADADALAAAYMRLYPLVQDAWRELGHADGRFNDRLVQVIDHLLQAPQRAQPPALELDPRGRYHFVDPDLQARSVGQKLLLRLDAEQSQAVRRQLRAIRQAVTRGSGE